MADVDQPDVVVNVPAAEPAPAPATEVVVAPAAEVVAEAAPAAEAPAADAPKTVAETPSLLEGLEGEKPAEAPAEGEKPADAPKPAEEKPAEAPKPDAPKPEDKPAEKPAEAPAEAAAPVALEYKYEIPEGMSLNDEQRGELHTALDAYRADPANVQPLMDYHVTRVNEVVEQVSRQQHDVFNQTRRTWNDEIKGDEQMGGSGFETTKQAVARMRDLLVSSHQPGTPEYARDSKAFNEFCRVTGAGDHPALWRLLHNAARYYDEASLPPSEINPAPQGKQPGNRRALMYDHPTSPSNKG